MRTLVRSPASEVAIGLPLGQLRVALHDRTCAALTTASLECRESREAILTTAVLLTLYRYGREDSACALVHHEKEYGPDHVCHVTTSPSPNASVRQWVADVGAQLKGA